MAKITARRYAASSLSFKEGRQRRRRSARRCSPIRLALAIWREALVAGPAASLETTLDTLKQDDGLEACVSIAWMPASALAASPRRYVRLLGLNSSRWPRGISEDRLLSEHIIPTAELDPLPVGAADRRDFETILVTTERQGRFIARAPATARGGCLAAAARSLPRAALAEKLCTSATPSTLHAE